MEKSLLLEDLKLSIPPKKIKHADYLVSFQLIYKDIPILEALSTEGLDFTRTKIKDIALLFALITTMCFKIYQK